MKMEIKRTFGYVICLSVLLSVSAGLCYGKDVSKVDEDIKQVALFKNGLGFLISEVDVPKGEKQISFTPCAAASHGTFWVSYDKDTEISSIVAKNTQADHKTEAITIQELIRANHGKRVNVYTSIEGKEKITGVIEYTGQQRPPLEPNPYLPGVMVSQSSHGRRYYPADLNASLVIIRTEQGETALNPQQIQYMEILDGPMARMFDGKKESMSLDIELAKPGKARKLSISYLANGITWAPSYIIDISDANDARLSAKAVVINEICDLEDVTLQLVTGFPHLEFAGIISPLAKKADLAGFLMSLNADPTQQNRYRGMVVSNVSQPMSQSVAYKYDMELAVMPEYGNAQQGKVSEDLFYYPIENVNLKLKETGYYPLFTETVPFKHIYQWHIDDFVDEYERYRHHRPQQEKEPEQVVWHSIKLDNKSSVPWTTAPAEIIKDNLILGQDLMRYTPKDATATVKITRAIGVKAEQAELEQERQRDAAQLYGYHYDLITLEGTLSVANFQDKPLTIEIEKNLSGEVVSSNPEAEVETIATGLWKMNASRKLTWNLEMEPGEIKKITYSYKVYVRR